MIDDLPLLAQHKRYTPIAKPAFVLVINTSNHPFSFILFIGSASLLYRVIKTAACHFYTLELYRQIVFMP